MKKILTLFSCIAVLGFTACDNNNETTERTPVTIKMTDAPAPFDAIFLDVEEIQILTSGGRESIDVDGDPFDILLYRMGRDTVIAGGDVPSGTIQEIRLILDDDDNYVVVDGVRHELKTPSGQSSGVKLKVHDELVPNLAYTLLLDFDAAQSIVQTGNGGYLLKPVIRAIPEAVSGAITGTVIPLEANPYIYAIDGTDSVGTIIDSDGRFWLPGLSEGTYKVVLDPADPYAKETIENVHVSTGSVEDLGTVELGLKMTE
ncbi:DUF4382 domain-containing protein [Albibacterium indicum]|uniref:DUF4382 domain-containing protein n=1 Tax=Albibacterium indicum TaxID=2292082 RepID=UPI000E49DF13|nr:DUF4382 domain-containing protein [Pedobacter indicus]